jgi:alkyl hydroperoxide reductase subunit AhpC
VPDKEVRVLGVGEKFPVYSLVANVSARERGAFKTITDRDYPGKWKVYFFWPKDLDFTRVTRNEIVEFGNLDAEFKLFGTQLLGGSIESEFAHLAWRNQDEALRGSPIPWLADTNRSLCGQLGILDEKEGVAQRATFIVDTCAVIRFVYVTELTISRDPAQVVRVLSHLRKAGPLDGGPLGIPRKSPP